MAELVAVTRLNEMPLNEFKKSFTNSAFDDGEEKTKLNAETQTTRSAVMYDSLGTRSKRTPNGKVEQAEQNEKAMSANTVELAPVTPLGETPQPGSKTPYTNAGFDGGEGAKGTNTSIGTLPSSGQVVPPSDSVGVTVEEDNTKKDGTQDDLKEEDLESSNPFLILVNRAMAKTEELWQKYKGRFWRLFCILLVLLYAAYFSYALAYKFGDEGSIRLLWITSAVVLVLVLKKGYETFGDRIRTRTKPLADKLSPHKKRINWLFVAALYIIIIIYIIVDVVIIYGRPYNLLSFLGIAVYILLFFVFSTNPSRIRWRIVVWGLLLQLVFALIILRWDFGYRAFSWLGARISEFLEYTDAGSKFVFGDPQYLDHMFAFKVLPVIIFFSATASILYYLGALQVLVRVIARVMHFTLGTTVAESTNAAGNIFLGQTESPLLIRNFLPDMTKSEFHAVMTSGFATIAGGVMASYISFGIPANHLLTASVMSAPAALAMSKLFYPETEKSKMSSTSEIVFPKGPERNVIEAASNGASTSIAMVANIAANLIAFIALLTFVNATLTWFGNRVGIEELTLQMICSYVLWPFAFLMGVDFEDCRKVAALLGIKTYLNEFVAYVDLSVLIDNRLTFTNHLTNNGSWSYVGDDIILHDANVTLIGGIITQRSEVITTYALCGFSNISSMGIQLGGLGALAPSRKSDMAEVVFRAMIAGNVACFMTACIAGLLYRGDL